MKQSVFAIAFLLLGALLPALAQAITDEVTYSYDDLNRLVQATHQQSGRVMDYGYDEVGNITSNIRKGTGVIQGTVTDANGAPLGNATMYATSTGDDPPSVKTDGNGHYRIDGLFPEKSYTLKAQLDPAYGWRINPQPITPTADGTVVDMVLSFPPLDFSVTGTVTLSPACGGAPLADAKVVISSSDSETSLLRTTITDADGNYALPGLPEYANYTLSVAPAATSGLRSVTVYGIDGTSTPAITQNVQIACGGPGIIGTVRIVNVSSQAYAVLWDADHNFVDYQPLTAQNAYGDYTFSFDNLPDGIYKLAISAAGTAPLWYQNAASFAEATPVTPGGPVISMIHPQQGISRNPQGCALYYLDSDQDGYGDPTVIAESCSGQPFGYVLTGNDCNDANASIHPSAVEICDDGIDQDCGNGDLASDPCGICGGDGLACTPAPHDASNAIGCTDCHAAAGGQPVDYACETCHTNSTGRDYDKFNAPAVPNHAHSGTASFYRGSGDFTLACWDCHQIHQQPAAQPLVTGAFTQWWDGGGEMLFNLNGFTVYDERSGQPVDCATSGDGWCEPAHWMQKTWQQFPYDPACEDPASAPPTVDCSNPVSPGERGLILWVTYASGRRASFELTYASATQLAAKGTVPAGETLASNATFALRYGMLVRTDLDPLGFCSPDPQGKFCYDTTSFPYTYNQGCGSNSDCPNGQSCQPRNYPVRCRNDADCPANSTCQMLPPPTPAAEFNGPGTEAYNENPGGADPSALGICQVCHVNTGHWRRDGSGADHHNGEICTACHLHRTAPTGACLSCHDLLGAHQKHIAQSGRGYACAECHMGGGSGDGDGLLQLGFNNLGMLSDGATQTGEGSVYHPLQNNQVFQATNGTQLAPVPAWDTSLKTCANVYCHSQAKRQIQGYDLPSLSASWDAGSSDIQGDGFTCNDCHAHPPTFDAHKSHHSRNFSCEICHAATAATSTSLLPGGSAHVNGVYDVVPAGEFYARGAWHVLTFQYTPPANPPGSGSCANNSCHQYYRYKDPAVWRNEEQVIRNAALQYTQGGPCATDAATGALSVGVVVDCPDCAPPYTCDFVWGDGSADSNVPCTFSHTYADIVPNATPYDPIASAIGGFAVTWAVRDSYGISLAEGTRTTSVQVCPYPNVAPVPNFTTALGPDPNKYDLCLTDRSTDADYNVGTHYDPANPPTYAAPGQIKIDWGGYAADGSGKGLSQQAAMLTALPGNQADCFTYDRSGYYYIRHSVMDNAGQWVASPVRVVKVSR